MTEIQFKSDIDVELVQHVGDDLTLAQAAWVSTGVAAEKLPEDVEKLIPYLMKHKHGCYDSETEVLTDAGWKAWPDVTGREKFLTLRLEDDRIEWQAAERLIRKEVKEPLVRIRMQHVDLLVTADHNLVASVRTSHGDAGYELTPARKLTERSYRLRMGGGRWGHTDTAAALPMRLVGFFIGDGSSPDGHWLSFNLKKRRKINYLADACADDIRLVFGNKEASEGPYAGSCCVRADGDLVSIFQDCYTADRQKQIPPQLLNAPREALEDLFDGLMNSDGTYSKSGKMTYSTSSRKLADQMQELAVKIGTAAVVRPHESGAGHYGTLPMWRVTIYRDRCSRPRVGWTTEDRQQQVTAVPYSGEVHCVTVPNGTLYVRRNGIPCWCGNTPFEHSLLTFRVRAPIFVWREWHRHRIGHSFNEESGRYMQLKPVFYIPDRERPMMKVDNWRPGRPKFTRCEDDQLFADIVADMKEGYVSEYARYERQLARNIDPGLARDNLPVGIFSTCWVTVNPRSTMAFLALRTSDSGASYPLWEIELAAHACETIFAKHWPITYKAFCDNGRVAP